MSASMPLLRHRGRMDYASAFAQMRAFTERRNAHTSDEIWLCEHPPVYTQGQAGQPEHLLAPGDIPVVQTNRGGQVTFHGPGQVVAYALIDLRRTGYFVKELVWRMEEAVREVLASYQITGHRVPGAPGIYVRLQDPGNQAALALPRPQHDPFAGLGKIAALGLKIHRQCSYHGVALNVAMDLEPFARIHPCGYQTLQATDLAACGVHTTWDEAASRLGRALVQRLAT